MFHVIFSHANRDEKGEVKSIVIYVKDERTGETRKFELLRKDEAFEAFELGPSGPRKLTPADVHYKLWGILVETAKNVGGSELTY